MRSLIFILILLTPSLAWAKGESGSYDAASVVIYGNNSGTIRPISVLSDGTVEVVL